MVSFGDFNGMSIHDFRVHGKLNSVIDITNSDNLKSFLKLIKKISTDPDLIAEAQTLGITQEPSSVKRMKELMDALNSKDWQKYSLLYDIPSNSQAFGYIVKLSKIEGILYDSKYSIGKCLAIFPENLSTGSFIKLSDPCAPGVDSLMDSSNYNLFL